MTRQQRLDRAEFLRAADSRHRANELSREARFEWYEAAQRLADAEGAAAEDAATATLHLAEARFRIQQEFAQRSQVEFEAVRARIPPPVRAAR